METSIAVHNTHIDSHKDVAKLDPQLRCLAKQTFQYRSPLLNEFPTITAGFYLLHGSYQVGKTTLLKQWISQLLTKHVRPDAILFLPGEAIDDHRVLSRLLNAHVTAKTKYLIIDEVTKITGWQQALQAALKSGLLKDIIVMLAGVNIHLSPEFQTAIKKSYKLPAKDFHLHPLSFREYLNLTKRVKNFGVDVEDKEHLDLPTMRKLYQRFDEYLSHGGRIALINDLIKEKQLNENNFLIFIERVRKDVSLQKKREDYSADILKALLENHGKALTWNNLAREIDVEHPQTIADYMALLESLHCVYIQHAISQPDLQAAPKKARKVWFNDSYLFHALRACLGPTPNNFQEQINASLNDPFICSQLVSSVVVNHFRRYFPTYYMKDSGDIDLVYVDKNKMIPIGIKWLQKPHSKNIKQLKTFKNACVWGKATKASQWEGLKLVPLPLALAQLQ